MGYLQELEALARWVYQVTEVTSHKLSEAPPKVARPVILWEGPSRRKGENLGRYHYTKRASQYGTLYVKDLDQLGSLIDKLEKNLMDRDEWLPMFESDQANARQIGKLYKVEIDFNNTQSTDMPFTIRYEVIYSRPIPEAAPAATHVGNKVKIIEGG
ncbi:hypothetical protein [Lysinibacillus sp. 54212]|uniref:hypothetical protein n=1 Tax=Lysinibacillus sp. 54212 TaxID=3119829 RepID=UPI002FCA2EFB